MAKNPGPQFSFFTASAAEKTAINDEYVFSVFTSQVFDVIVDNVCSKKRSEMEPVCFAELRKQ